MPTLDEIYKNESTFLKAIDLKTSTGFAKPIVEISGSEVVQGNDGKSQIVLFFLGKEKKLGLNKINAERIAVHTGSRDSDDWVGWKIKLLVEKVNKPNGEPVDGIRVSSEWCEAPAGKQPATSGESDDVIPF